MIVDDDPQIRTLLAERLKFHKYRVSTAEDGEEGLDKFEKEGADIVLLDMMMPGLDGMETLIGMKKQDPEVLVIMLTAFGTIEKAVEAIKKGAYDFIPKPCEPEHILLKIQKALERKNLVSEKEYLKEEIDREYGMVWGESSEMKKIKELVEKVANTKSTICFIISISICNSSSPVLICIFCHIIPNNIITNCSPLCSIMVNI